MLDISLSNAWVLIAAAVAGGVGGIAAALILLDPTQNQAGLPAGTRAWSVVAIRALVGAVASAAFLFFFPVQQVAVVGAHGHLFMRTTYSFLKVVALGLVVGSGGSAFLSAMRNRTDAMITATQAKEATTTAKEVAKTALNATPGVAGAAALEQATASARQTHRVASEQIQRVASGLPPAIGRLGTKSFLRLNQTIADATGDRYDVADPALATDALTSQVGPTPERIAADVKSTVQDHVNRMIEQLDQLGS